MSALADGGSALYDLSDGDGNDRYFYGKMDSPKSGGLASSFWLWTTGEWARNRLWVLYWGYVSYLFLHDTWEAFGLTLAFEAVSMCFRYLVAINHYEREGAGMGRSRGQDRASFVLFDIVFRVVMSHISVIVATFMAWVLDLSTFEGQWEFGWPLLAIMFVFFREGGRYYLDYLIFPIHAALFGIFSTTVFMSEVYNYVALAVYGVFLAGIFVLTKYRIYWPLGVYAVVMSVFIGTWHATHSGRLPLSYYFSPSKMKMP